MNFDDLKSAWENEKPDNLEAPKNIEQLKTLRMPLDQLRSRMKCEFWWHCAAILFVGAYPLTLNFGNSFIISFYTLYALFFSICLYYNMRLWFFYKRLEIYKLNTMESLYETYYDIKLHVEIYKSYTYALMPFGIIFALMLILDADQVNLLSKIVAGKLSEKTALYLASSMAATIIIVMVITEFWAGREYGRYAAKIRSLLDQMKEE